MGNSNATLAIGLDAPAVYAGGVVSGRVYLVVHSPCDASSISLVIEGEEHAYTRWEETETRNGKTKRHRRDAHASRSLLKLQTAIAAFSAPQIMPGRYEFPFTAELPLGLPSSLFAQGGEGECRIAYSVRATLQRSGWTLMQGTVAAKAPLHVAAAPLQLPAQPFFARPDTETVAFCCCIGQGRITLGARVEDTVVGRGDQLLVGAVVQNESHVEPRRLYVQVKESVSWEAGGHSSSDSRVVAYTEYDPHEVKGLRARSRDSVAMITAEPVRRSVLEGMHESLLGGGAQRTLTCHSQARDTYIGAVLAVQHEMTIRVETPCCVTDPEIKVPVRVAERAAPLGEPVSSVDAVPVVAMPIAAPLDGEEMQTQQALDAKPPDWNSTVVVATVVGVPMGEAVVGGLPGEAVAAEAVPVSLEGAIGQTVISAEAQAEGTLPALLEQMSRTYDDPRLLQELMPAPAWADLFASLNAPSFAEIVAQTTLPLSRAQVAELLGRQLSDGVSVDHIVESCIRQRGESGSISAAIVQRLAPLCVNLDQHGREEIEATLSDWERVLARSALDEATSMQSHMSTAG